NLCKLQRAGDRRGGASLDDAARDAAALIVLAVAIDQLRQRRLTELVHRIGGAWPFLLHAHVQLSVRLKRKAPRALVELDRSHAEVEDAAVDGRDRRQIAKAALMKREFIGMSGD